MYIEYIVASDVIAHLAYGFQERLSFDVAHRTAHLHQDNIRT